MKATRLLATALIGMVAAMNSAAAAVMHRGATVRQPKTLEPSRTVGSSRNGGRRDSNRGMQRAALKRRNVLRHRKACRG